MSWFRGGNLGAGSVGLFIGSAHGPWGQITSAGPTHPRGFLRPEGLVVGSGSGAETLPWEDGDGADEPGGLPCRRSWSLVSYRGSQDESGYVAVVRHRDVGHLHADREVRHGGEVTVLGESYGPGDETIPPLLAALSERPNLRAGLADPARGVALLDRLGTGHWKRPHPPREPLMGSRLDAHHSARSVLCHHRLLFGGRLIGDEDLPSIERLATAAQDLNNTVLAPPPEQVLEMLVKFIDAGRWPFAELQPRS